MSLETKLFEEINKCNYVAAIALLAQNKNININALDEDGCSFLMASTENYRGVSEERYVFMEQLLSNPDFQHASRPLEGATATPFKSAIFEADPRAVDLLLKYKEAKGIQVIFDKDKLWYEQQVKSIQTTKDALSSEPDLPFQDMLEKKQKNLATLLLTTVHHAIQTDDPSILKRLADAGAKLHHPLKDGTYPMDLVKNDKLKVHEWLSTYIKEQIQSNPAYILAARNLARKHGEQEQAIVEKYAEAKRSAITSMFKFYEYKPEAKPSEKDAQSPEANHPKL